jgi:hypothetical protein
MTDTSLLEAALAIAARGIPVFPCWNAPGTDRHKRPLTKYGFKDATPNANQIRRWWGKEHPNALIGVPTGRASGVYVLDLDVKKGKNGLDHVKDWRELSPCIARTGSGGVHVFFRSDGTIRNSSDKIALGVDTRGEGGYVIVAPSSGYEWLAGDLSTDLPPFPDRYRPPARQGEPTPNAEPQADIEKVHGWLTLIPNDDIGWDEWNDIGMAIFRATGGSAEGRLEFHKWSSKSAKKYSVRETDARWDGYFRSPPSAIGAGTLAFKAREGEYRAFNELAAAVLARDATWEECFPVLDGAEAPLALDAPPDALKSAAPPLPNAPKPSHLTGSKSSVIRAKPFVWVEPKSIPRRQWLYKPSYIRGYASLTGGATGVAKSSLTIVEALAMASGRALLGVKPEKRLRV